jgi:PPOX class probable F420-dependent enzyme
MSSPRSPRHGRIDRPAPAIEAFLAANYIGTLTTLRPTGAPHVAPVRFTWDADAGLVRVLTMATARKARNLAAGPGSRAVLCQVDGFRWVTLEGPAVVSDDPERVAEGAKRYTERYFSPPPNQPGRVVVEIAVDRLVSLNVDPRGLLS